MASIFVTVGRPWDDETLDPEELLEELARSVPSWHADALCREAPASVSWFPERGQDSRPAKATCERCLVATDCRAWALGQDPDLAGIWAGMSPQDRRAIKAGRAACI